MEQKQPTDTKKLTEAIEDLETDIEDLDQTLEQSLKAQGTFPTFMRGVIGSLGALIGATLVIGLLVYILQKLAGVPFIGHYILTLLNQLQQGK